MRLLSFSDLHLDKPFRSFRAQAGDRRRRALRRTLTNIIDCAQEHAVDALLCAGDLFESDAHVTPDTRRFLERSFREFERPVLLAPGNHDYLSPTGLYRRAEWSENVHVFDCPRFTCRTLEDGFFVWGAAFTEPRRTRGFFDESFIDREGVHVGLFHGAETSSLPFQGRKEPYAPFTHADVERSGLLHAFVGHYHRSELGAWHTYPGNPDPLTYGEEGERGAVLVEFMGDRISRTILPVAASSVLERCVDVGGVTHSDELLDRVRSVLEGCEGCVRLRLNGELDPEVAPSRMALEELGAHLDDLQIHDEVVPALDVRRFAEDPGVMGQFVRDVSRADHLDEDERRRVLLTGLRAFLGNEDLELT